MARRTVIVEAENVHQVAAGRLHLALGGGTDGDGRDLVQFAEDARHVPRELDARKSRLVVNVPEREAGFLAVPDGVDQIRRILARLRP